MAIECEGSGGDVDGGADGGPHSCIGGRRGIVLVSVKRHERSYRGAALAERRRNTLAVAV